MERLRPLADRLILVVNKIDTPDRESLVWNAHAHGFPLVVGVSAAHHGNLDELRDVVAAFLQSAREREEAARTAAGHAQSAEAAGRG